MSSKHTPGPWSWYTRNGHRVAIDGSGGAEVARAEEYGASAWIEVSEDDARLIAAAPELLYVAELVDDVSDRIDHDPDSAFGQLVAAARAAIAKATGGEQ